MATPNLIFFIKIILNSSAFQECNCLIEVSVVILWGYINKLLISRRKLVFTLYFHI